MTALRRTRFRGKKGEQVGEIKISIYRIYLYVAHFSGSLTFGDLKNLLSLLNKTLPDKHRCHSHTSVTNF